jgi:hypothetical protein
MTPSEFVRFLRYIRAKYGSHQPWQLSYNTTPPQPTYRNMQAMTKPYTPKLPDEQPIVVPDSTEYYVGWRGWACQTFKPGEGITRETLSGREKTEIESYTNSHAIPIVVLHSPTYDVLWLPGKPFNALCRNRSDPAPHAGHWCGVHVADDLDRVVYSGGPTVAGLVKAWGRIAKHEHGFRAQYAQPIAFLETAPIKKLFGWPYRSPHEHYVDEADVATLAWAYGVPVITNRAMHNPAAVLEIVRALVQGTGTLDPTALDERLDRLANTQCTCQLCKREANDASGFY